MILPRWAAASPCVVLIMTVAVPLGAEEASTGISVGLTLRTDKAVYRPDEAMTIAVTMKNDSAARAAYPVRVYRPYWRPLRVTAPDGTMRDWDGGTQAKNRDARIPEGPMVASLRPGESGTDSFVVMIEDARHCKEGPIEWPDRSRYATFGRLDPQFNPEANDPGIRGPWIAFDVVGGRPVRISFPEDDIPFEKGYCVPRQFGAFTLQVRYEAFMQETQEDGRMVDRKVVLTSDPAVIEIRTRE